MCMYISHLVLASLFTSSTRRTCALPQDGTRCWWLARSHHPSLYTYQVNHKIMYCCNTHNPKTYEYHRIQYDGTVVSKTNDALPVTYCFVQFKTVSRF